jgi:hypothetical protein
MTDTALHCLSNKKLFVHIEREYEEESRIQVVANFTANSAPISLKKMAS